ncbi:hypothetical protein OSB04_028255 [Centaurea solstitialis]|uniref:Uncharacterized protein n=1 Tax=Centaurea solstitialis TaxID=347529 RepID=A0AA38SGW2_9ASTR|nr:hypothetical protein OSB04_028255 [Centaurea solstitialis]
MGDEETRSTSMSKVVRNDDETSILASDFVPISASLLPLPTKLERGFEHGGGRRDEGGGVGGWDGGGVRVGVEDDVGPALEVSGTDRYTRVGNNKRSCKGRQSGGTQKHHHRYHFPHHTQPPPPLELPKQPTITISACTRNHHCRRLNKQQPPPLPSSQPEYIRQQLKNTIDALIDAGAFVTSASILFNPNSIQLTITTFTTAALVPATTTMFKTLPRHATLLPSKTVIITNNTSSNFTTGDALVMQLHVYLKAAVCIHVIGWLLD